MTATERKMAAILAMDVASYSEKMDRDEEGTLRYLLIKQTFVTNKLAYVEKQFDIWNNNETLSIYKPAFQAYGFE